MIIDDAVFQQGETYRHYHDRIMAEEGVMRDMLTASERIIAETELDLAPFERLGRPLRVLVLSEDWCGDCTDNLPILDRIARETGKLEVRIVPRDAHPEIMDAHLKHGQFRSIPLMLVLDERGAVLGAFKERPDSVTSLRADRRAELYAAHPEFGTPETAAALPEATRAALGDALLAMRDETRPFAIAEVVRELGEIAAKGAA